MSRIVMKFGGTSVGSVERINHVADIVERYGSNTDEVPESLTSYIKNRKGYDYSKHGQSDNPYLDFIT